jgi:chromosome segregation ATPase
VGIFGRDTLQSMSKQVEELSVQLAQMRGERSTLELERRLEALALEKTELEIRLRETRAEAQRQELEIDHKLGLHRTQIESEKRIMVAEAEAAKSNAVAEAKLAVREGNLEEERKRFEQEIEFRTKRFEEEAATLRDLTGQILARLPNVTATFTQTVGEKPAALGRGGDA